MTELIENNADSTKKLTIRPLEKIGIIQIPQMEQLTTLEFASFGYWRFNEGTKYLFSY